MCQCFVVATETQNRGRKQNGWNKRNSFHANKKRRQLCFSHSVGYLWFMSGSKIMFFCCRSRLYSKNLMIAREENIADRSTIFPDCWKGCKTCELQDDGFEHFTVNHTYNFVDLDTSIQTAEWLWNRVKWCSKCQHGNAHHCLQSYRVYVTTFLSYKRNFPRQIITISCQMFKLFFNFFYYIVFFWFLDYLFILNN